MTVINDLSESSWVVVGVEARLKKVKKQMEDEEVGNKHHLPFQDVLTKEIKEF